MAGGPAVWAGDVSLILLAVAANRKTACSASPPLLQPIKIGDLYRLAEISSSGAALRDDTMRREALGPTARKNPLSPLTTSGKAAILKMPDNNSATQLPELTRIDPTEFRRGVARHAENGLPHKHCKKTS